MPTVLRVEGYRFFFFSNEREEPAHIHVEQAERYAKFWIDPISLAANAGFRSSELGTLRRLVEQHQRLFQSGGMSTSAIKVEPRAVDVACTKDTLTVRLADGREISAPLEWFPRLRAASPEALRDWRVVGGGIGIRWAELDEDISVEGLLATR